MRERWPVLTTCSSFRFILCAGGLILSYVYPDIAIFNNENGYSFGLNWMQQRHRLPRRRRLTVADVRADGRIADPLAAHSPHRAAMVAACLVRALPALRL
jgi:hypothetical protein